MYSFRSLHLFNIFISEYAKAAVLSTIIWLENTFYSQRQKFFPFVVGCADFCCVQTQIYLAKIVRIPRRGYSKRQLFLSFTIEKTADCISCSQPPSQYSFVWFTISFLPEFQWPFPPGYRCRPSRKPHNQTQAQYRALFRSRGYYFQEA